MLILSRQKDEKIRFPDLGISVQVIDIRGSRVRLGVHAPLEVRVLRDELKDHKKGAGSKQTVFRIPQELRHEMRNALNEVMLMLHVYQTKQEACLAAKDSSAKQLDANLAFETIIDKLKQFAAHDSLTSGKSEPPPQAIQPANGSRMLLVEDNANERELLAGFLRISGQTVATAADGTEAIEYLERETAPDLMLVDMLMPRCDGRTLIKHLRSKQRFDEMQIYVTSGRSASEAGLDQEQHRLNGWFLKPLDPKLLAETLIVQSRNA
ncbi:response regulator [Aeoliella mucimassa]|uniref:Translational regulator CsrA n=1 Tax=Aeoliella mucimassa TaxID=2527972 RepID=A0A518AS93_9BACT|nr:response regulator [Aeoliella mucimassa]QDU57590.1 Regulator of RpoS [Aeoliella mucimassa]